VRLDCRLVTDGCFYPRAATESRAIFALFFAGQRCGRPVMAAGPLFLVRLPSRHRRRR